MKMQADAWSAKLKIGPKVLVDNAKLKLNHTPKMFYARYSKSSQMNKE